MSPRTKPAGEGRAMTRASGMIAVTGGAGFLGRHLVEALTRGTRPASVRALDLHPPDSGWPPAVEGTVGSVLDPELVAAVVDGVDTVVHLAAKVDPESDDHGQLHRVNVEGTRTVFTASVAAGIRHFVHVSSAGVYGPPSRPRASRETDPPNPRTPYQRSKWEAEEALRSADSGTTVLNILRPSGVYGPGSRLEIPRYRNVLRQRLVLEPAGGVRVHPTYVSDVVEGIVALLDRPAPHGAVFNIGGERPLLVQELEALIAEELGVRRRRFAVPGWLAGPAAKAAEPLLSLLGRGGPGLHERWRGDVLSAAVDDTRFRRGYPEVPVTDLRTGVREHLRWARREGLLGEDR